MKRGQPHRNFSSESRLRFDLTLKITVTQRRDSAKVLEARAASEKQHLPGQYNPLHARKKDFQSVERNSLKRCVSVT